MTKYNIEELTEFVKNTLSEKRFLHTLGVAKLAKEIAQFNNIDPDKAYVAGLLHDITKEKDEAWQDEVLRKNNDSVKIKAPRKIKHSYTGKYFVKDELGIDDEDILDAIYNHTICMSDKPLAKIIYISDKREEGRKLDNKEVEVARANLDAAYRMVKEDVSRYLELKGNGQIIK